MDGVSVGGGFVNVEPNKHVDNFNAEQKYIKTIAELRTALKNSIEYAGHQTERYQSETSNEVKELLEALRELYLCQWTQEIDPVSVHHMTEIPKPIGNIKEAIRKTQKVLQKYEKLKL